MEQDHGVSIGAHGPEAPSTQRRAVGGGNGNLRQLSVVARGQGLCALFILRPQRAPSRVQRQLGRQNAPSGAGNKPDRNKNSAPP
jgi:hypothetical protein